MEGGALAGREFIVNDLIQELQMQLEHKNKQLSLKDRHLQTKVREYQQQLEKMESR